MPFETFNKFFVSVHADGVVILRPPTRPISADDALNLAAWLVSVAGSFPGFYSEGDVATRIAPEDRLAEILRDIRST